MTSQQIIAYFYAELVYTDREIALLVSAHAGRAVPKRTIVGILMGEAHYTGPTSLRRSRRWLARGVSEGASEK